MRILITGNSGYVGSVLSRFLRERYPDAELYGFDSGLFFQCLSDTGRGPETYLDQQFFGDVRDIDAAVLESVDAVVCLSAVSNDPMGKRFAGVTMEINKDATVGLARMSAAAGVKNFVFASSCSMYGAASGAPKMENDPTNPLTAYAQSKIESEMSLRELPGGEMVVTSLRFATACGFSSRLRLDLVLNDFVACALAAREISVLSDGSPWRPLIDVEDMARAISWAISRKSEQGGTFLAVNTGHNKGNYQVAQLAQAVADAIPGTSVAINRNAAPDNRSYKVDFSLFGRLAPEFTPRIDLTTSIMRLRDGLESLGFQDKKFRSSNFMRLNVLKQHIDTGQLSEKLRWL